ncbi:MAG: hypothetical protein ACOYMP_01365 [Nodosilinea sp.]
MDNARFSRSNGSISASSTATLPSRSGSSSPRDERGLPYTPDQQVELLHLQVEVDVLLLQLQALSVKAD